MLQRIRIIVLSALLVFSVYHIPSVNAQIQQVFYGVTDRFDSRPERAILFIGNSRTYYHDMPYMVRKIADSAGAKEKYRVVVHAPGGVRFEDHWNNPAVHKLLKQRWHEVVLQGRSNEQQNNTVNASFHTYGAKLIREAQAAGAVPVLYVTWRYADNFSLYKEIPALKTQLYDLMQSNSQQLAQATGARIVNVGKAWERLLSQRPTFPLYEDGNHPTVYGSYLAALMLYKYFSGADVSQISYVPRGIKPNEAALIRKIAQGM